MKPKFIVAVFSQPVSSFDKWIARGINTLVSHEPEGGRMPKSTWENEATQRGLYFMNYPSDDDAVLQNEAKQTHRLAFMQDDEPDLTRAPANSERFGPDGWTRPHLLAQRYARCKAAAPHLPVFCNFAGTAVTPDAYKGEKHLPYIAAADWLAHDWYVKNKNHARYPISLIGKAMDRLAAWSQNKPQFVFIECSDQKISALGRIPTPDEVEEEVNLAVSKGAKGIIYFPQRPPPGFMYDATPPEIVAKVTAINARLSAPAQNEPTVRELMARIDELSREIVSLKQRKFKATVELHSDF